MKVRGMLCALAAGSCLVAAAVPTASGETGCGPGYEEGANEQYDTDGDGLVCVNQETGEVADDQGGQAGIVDRNADGIVCVKPTNGGTVVVTDNNSSHEENAGCPPGFQPSPLT